MLSTNANVNIEIRGIFLMMDVILPYNKIIWPFSIEYKMKYACRFTNIKEKRERL